MKREIKFRAFGAGLWRYGDLRTVGKQTQIVSTKYDMTFNIDTKTIGQYIGIKDINGVEIFEGDIVKAMPHYGRRTKKNYTVVWFDEKLQFAFYRKDKDEETLLSLSDIYNKEIEVVGNIYENEKGDAQ